MVKIRLKQINAYRLANYMGRHLFMQNWKKNKKKSTNGPSRYSYPLGTPTVCLVWGCVGWVGSNSHFGDGSNLCFVWLLGRVRSSFLFGSRTAKGWSQPVTCLDGWIGMKPECYHLCSPLVRLPPSI